MIEISNIEWERYGNNAVHIPNMGPIDSGWTMCVGGTVLVRGKDGGWFMVDLEKDSWGYFAICLQTRIPIVWDDKRQVWASTVRV